MNYQSVIRTALMSGLIVAGASVAQAKPVQYVKVCSLYGAGFYYIPGSNTCVKISGGIEGGWALGQTNWNPLFSGDDADHFNLSGGTVGAFVSARFLDPKTNLFIGGEFGANYLNFTGTHTTVSGDWESTRLNNLFYGDMQLGFVTQYGSPYLLIGLGTAKNTSANWSVSQSQYVSGAIFGGGFDFNPVNNWSVGFQLKVFVPEEKTFDQLGYSIKTTSEIFTLRVQRNFNP
jgi:hypothetical protein